MIAQAPHIPPLTAEKLIGFHPEGTRHKAKIDLALSLIGNGVPAQAVEVTLRQKFPGATDKEISDVIRWVSAHNPRPSVFDQAPNRPDLHAHAPQKATQPSSGVSMADLDSEVSEWDLFDLSPVKPAKDFVGDAKVLVDSLYQPDDCLNIVCCYTIAKTNGRERANPRGAGKILPGARWLRWFEQKGVPFSEAGAWMRPNPVAPKGSGTNGAVMDCDIVAPRFLLIESDSLPFEAQLCAIASWSLPIAAILTSGGSSYHAWVRLDCENLEEYRLIAERVFGYIGKFGFDLANKNPSRLSRLPGAPRKIHHGNGDGRQRLIYLNPEPCWRSIL